MSEVQPLDADEIRKMVADFYEKGNNHAPVIEYLPWLDENIKIEIAGVPDFNGHTGFEEWYGCMTRQLFDEEHDLKKIEPKISGDQAEVEIVMNMSARLWNPPAPKSAKLDCVAYLTWRVKRSPKTGTPVITYYAITGVDFHPGSVLYIPDRYRPYQFLRLDGWTPRRALHGTSRDRPAVMALVRGRRGWSAGREA